MRNAAERIFSGKLNLQRETCAISNIASWCKISPAVQIPFIRYLVSVPGGFGRRTRIFAQLLFGAFERPCYISHKGLGLPFGAWVKPLPLRSPPTPNVGRRRALFADRAGQRRGRPLAGPERVAAGGDGGAAAGRHGPLEPRGAVTRPAGTVCGVPQQEAVHPTRRGADEEGRQMPNRWVISNKNEHCLFLQGFGLPPKANWADR